MMGRQTTRGQQSLFGFGRSRARLYNQERPAITFADVAREEEVKAELLEVVDFLKRPDRYRTETRDTGLGVHVADLPPGGCPAGKGIDFTFRWAEEGRWENMDFCVLVG